MLALLAAAVLTVTNAPASFSTTTEQTFSCPTLPAKDAWMVFDLDLRNVGSRRAEFAVGRDVNEDGKISDDESPFAVSYSNYFLSLRNGKGEVLASSEYLPSGIPLSLALKPGRRGAVDSWKIVEEGSEVVAEGVFVSENAVVSDLTHLRVRVSGPDLASTTITVKRGRDALVLTIR